MGGYAWVTLATNDSYSLGALVLAHSLKQVGTKQQLAVVITPGVTEPMRTKLREVFNLVKEVNVLDSKDEANLRLLKRPELGITFTKLHCWRLTQYEKCVFLDADTLVLENCDELFEREELSAAPDIGWPDCFNSGVFVYRPSDETYEKLIQFALEKGSFDGGDQGLLNQFFSDWAHKDISKHLPFIYNVASTACYSYLPAFKKFGANAKIIHFIGSTKPWLQYFDTETGNVRATDEVRHLQDILQRWWNIFCTLVHPSLSPDMNIPSPTDTVHGSQSNNSQNIIHTSYYYRHENTPDPDIPNPAENYQHVWDPWEEYDSRQLNNQQCESNKNTIVHTSDNFSQPISHDNYEHSHSNINEFHSNHHETHSHHHETHSHYHETHSHHHETHSHSNITETHIPVKDYHTAEHQYHNPPHSDFHKQNELVEPHNTNANIDAHHDHCIETPIPTYSQPHTPTVIHYEPPQCHIEETHKTKPPSPPHSEPCPRLPDECVATTTVSNEISLHTGSNEDRYEDDAGIAGAFARLTLGVKRTPEQEALEDHLRRQGWEVGNIDYLGRDSFENIWSKICETITSDGSPAPPPQLSQTAPIIEQPKEPSPPKTAAEPTKETAPVEPEKIVQPEQETTIIESPVTKQSESKPQDDFRDVSKPVQSTESLESEPLKTTVEIYTKPAAYTSGKPASLTTSAPIPDALSQLPASPSPTSISESASSTYPTSIVAPSLSIPVSTPNTVSTATTPSPVSITSLSVSAKKIPTAINSGPVSLNPKPACISPALIPASLTPVPASSESIHGIPAPGPSSPAPLSANQTPSPATPTPFSATPTSIPVTPEPAVPTCPVPIPTEIPAQSTICKNAAPTPENPISICSAPILRKQTSAPEKQTLLTYEAQSLASAPEIPFVTSTSRPSSVYKQSPKEESHILQPNSSECPVPSKQSTGKKSKESVKIPKAEVTEATPPAIPLSPPPKLGKQTLGAQQSTPDTSPPTDSSTGPTPPPRKSCGGSKKVAGKGKK